RKEDGGMLFKYTADAPIYFQINLGAASSECASILISWRNLAPASYTVYATSATAGFTPSEDNKILTVENEIQADCNRLITFDTRQKFGRIVITFDTAYSTVQSEDTTVPAILLTELGVYNRAYSANIEVSDDYGVFSEGVTCWTQPETLVSGNQVFGGGNAYLLDDSDIGVDENGETKKYTVYIHSSSSDELMFNKAVYKDLNGKRLIVVADGWYLGVSNGVKVYRYNGEFVLGSGDINGDSLINSADLILMRKKLLDAVDFNNSFADVNGDRSVNILDLVKLKKKV
ncbi:MAG: dockerin type I repeat-containing protein, partial [Acutalibacteraceae bacterium]